jgi:ATP-dependent DNA helicase RecG
MEQLAIIPRTKRKIDRETMKRVILALCSNQYVTLDCIAVFVCRNAKSMQSQFLTPMVRDERTLQWAFPATPNDPRQAYITASTMPDALGKEQSG